MRIPIGAIAVMGPGLAVLAGCGTLGQAPAPAPAPPAVAATTTTTLAAVVDPLARTYTKAELLGDFEHLAGLVERTHPKLYADRALLAERIAANRGRVAEGMTELEFLRLLSPIVSALNCGHSSISLSAAYQKELATRGKYFPLPLRFIDGRAYVSQNGLAEAIPIGSEVLAINGMPTAEIIRTLFGNLPADGWNETYKYLLLNGWFRYRYQNFIDSRGDYEISYRSGPAGEALTARLPGATNAEIAARNGPTWVEREVPYAASFGEGHAVLSMYSFYPEGPYSIADFRKFIDAFFLQVRERGIGKLILDVRDNGGGDPEVTSHLWSYLARREQPYFARSAPDFYPGLKSPIPLAENLFGGELYVLMSGGSFSSTGHLLALLKGQGIGTFIGEESGASFACTDSSRSFTLPVTRIQFKSSTQVWAVAAEGLVPGRGIMPDHAVAQDIGDFLAGRDLVMEYALRLVGNKGGD